MCRYMHLDKNGLRQPGYDMSDVAMVKIFATLMAKGEGPYEK